MKLNSVAAKTIAKPAAGRANTLNTAPRASKKSGDDDDFDEDEDLDITEDDDINGDYDDDDITEINVKEPASFEDFDDDEDDDDDDF